MGSREFYNRFVGLCKRWPKDETKYGRDYGEFFRKQFQNDFPHGEFSTVKDPIKLEQSLSALERLANNVYYKENPLKRSSASGLEAESCKIAISTDGLRAIQEQEENGITKRLKKALSVKFIEDSKTNNKID